MARFMLDTTFIVDQMRRDPGAKETLARIMEDGDELFLNEIVACEAWSGMRVGEEESLAVLLRLPEFVQPGPDAVERAALWRRDARARGWTLSLTDALIAAAAEACDAAILTRNGRDFALTPVPVVEY